MFQCDKSSCNTWPSKQTWSTSGPVTRDQGRSHGLNNQSHRPVTMQWSDPLANRNVWSSSGAYSNNYFDICLSSCNNMHCCAVDLKIIRNEKKPCEINVILIWTFKRGIFHSCTLNILLGKTLIWNKKLHVNWLHNQQQTSLKIYIYIVWFTIVMKCPSFSSGICIDVNFLLLSILKVLSIFQV